MAKNENEEKELLVFGYACKLFRDDERAEMIDNETHLIPWMGDTTLKIDRYDGRGALYDLVSHEPKPGAWEALGQEERHLEEICDQERYRSLYINEVEEQTYKEENAKRLQQDYGQIGYNYENPESSPEATEPTEAPSRPFQPTAEMALPADMNVPETMKHSAIIERTALFIAQQGSQMEILMKLKQHGNKNFDFLSHNDPLHEFYKHILALIKSGSYVPTSQDLDDNVNVSVEDDDEHYLHPSLVTKVTPQTPQNVPPPPSTAPSAEKKQAVEPPELMQKVIAKMVEYTVRNGPAFEREIMRKEDARFSFIRSADQFYPYYRSLLIQKQRIYNEELHKKLRSQKPIEDKSCQPEDMEKGLKKKPLPVHFSLKKPKEPKSLEVASALPVEESSDEEEEGTGTKQQSAPPKSPPQPPSPPKLEASDFINPLTKKLKTSSVPSTKFRSKKDSEIQTERKMKVAQFLKDLKKKSS